MRHESSQYSERVEAILAPSRRGRALAAGAASATLGLLATTPLAPELRALSACCVALLLVRALRGLRAGRCIRVEGSGALCVDGRSGRLVPGSFVAPWLTTVRWRPGGAWIDRGLLVLPDMLPPQDFRRLRVLLKA